MADSYVIHLYTAKKRRTPNFKSLCTKEWSEETDFRKAGIWGRQCAVHFTHNESKVTCPNCLEILIPQIEADLIKMKEAYERNKIHIGSTLGAQKDL